MLMFYCRSNIKIHKGTWEEVVMGPVIMPFLILLLLLPWSATSLFFLSEPNPTLVGIKRTSRLEDVGNLFLSVSGEGFSSADGAVGWDTALLLSDKLHKNYRNIQNRRVVKKVGNSRISGYNFW